MIHRVPVVRFVLILLVILVPAVACQQTAATSSTPQTDAARSPAPDLPYDRTLTDVARVLGGMLPEDPSRFTNITNLASWQAFHQQMDTDWASDLANRYKAVATWRDRELGPLENNCHTLMYPFAGPDIMNAYQFFPACDTYVLFGLEQLGSAPKLDRLSATDGDRLVADVHEALSDLFTRHYFITKTMMTELSGSYVNGTLPVMLLMLARLDAHIMNVERLVLTEKGLEAPTAGAQNQVAAVRVTFVQRGSSHPQSVVYFRAQAEDAGIEKRPVVRAYLRSYAPYITMLKSASYLLHDPQFSVIRTDLLDGSSAILQDDSGMPYRFLKTPKWKVTLYGKYSKPVSDFNYGYQKDLEAAYTAANPPELPFSYGYHWRDGHFGVMLALRNPGEPESAPKK
jgi:hypothetical protein